MRAALGVPVASLLLLAGPFWEASAPSEWTATQLDKILLDSPWAKPARVDFFGDGSKSVGPGRFPAPFPGGRRGPLTDFARSAFDTDVVVRWESAQPVRYALAARAGIDGADLGPPSEHYVLALTALPLGAARLAQEPDKIRSNVALLRGDKPQTPAERVEIAVRPGVPGVRLYFSREAAIDLDDGSVELLMHLDQYQVRRKFKLKDMVFRGRLEL